MPKQEHDFKLIKGSRLIDGNGGPPLEQGALLIQNSKIIEIGTEESVVAPEGANVQEFDYEDQTVLPGLVDCHVHLIGIGDGRKGDDLTTLPDEVLTLQAARNARTHLYSGVTTVRDCGAKNRTTFMLREAVNLGITPAPRLILAGRPMSIIGGHLSYFGIEATGEDECRANVRQLVKEGADFIKITATGGTTQTSFPYHPSFTLKEMQAITDEAHKFGKNVAAHCASSQGIINALDSEVDTLIHCYFCEPDSTFKYQPTIAERIASSGTWVNPTLYQAKRSATVLEDLVSNSLATTDQVQELDQTRKKHDYAISYTSKMVEQGAKLVAGSDSAWSHYKMGGFHHEIATHVDAGLSPMQAIVSATRDSARSCNTDDKVGTLEIGKEADILVVNGDPSKTITDLENVVDVFLAGNRIMRDNEV